MTDESGADAVCCALPSDQSMASSSVGVPSPALVRRPPPPPLRGQVLPHAAGARVAEGRAAARPQVPCSWAVQDVHEDTCTMSKCDATQAQHLRFPVASNLKLTLVLAWSHCCAGSRSGNRTKAQALGAGGRVG